MKSGFDGGREHGSVLLHLVGALKNSRACESQELSTAHFLNTVNTSLSTYSQTEHEAMEFLVEALAEKLANHEHSEALRQRHQN